MSLCVARELAGRLADYPSEPVRQMAREIQHAIDAAAQAQNVPAAPLPDVSRLPLRKLLEEVGRRVSHANKRSREAERAQRTCGKCGKVSEKGAAGLCWNCYHRARRARMRTERKPNGR